MSSWIYQGHVGSGGTYERKAGLRPDGGKIVMPFEEAGEFILRVRAGLFPPAIHGKIAAQPVHVLDWPRIPIGERGADEIIISPGGEKGFEISGDLIMQAEAPAGGGEETLTVVRGVYIAPNGLRMTSEDLFTQDFKSGEVEISLTDIRIFWGRYGVLYGDVNVVLPGGALDLRSLEADTNPVRLDRLLRAAVHALPGAPRLRGLPAGIHEEDAPTKVLRFEDPAAVLSELFEKLDFDITLHRDQSVTIFSKARARHTPSVFPGNPSPPAANLSVGPLQQWRWNDVPVFVMVAGGPVHQNVTQPAFAVMPDLEHNLKPQDIVLEEWGYPKLIALRQATIEEQKRYLNLWDYDPPIAKGDPQIIMRMIKILRKCAFKWFLLGSAHNNVPERFRNPDLPMRDRAVYETRGSSALSGPRAELSALLVDLIKGEVPGGERARADGGPVRLEVPRVLAPHVTQHLIDRPEILLKILEQQREDLIKARGRTEDSRENFLEAAKRAATQLKKLFLELQIAPTRFTKSVYLDRVLRDKSADPTILTYATELQLAIETKNVERVTQLRTLLEELVRQQHNSRELLAPYFDRQNQAYSEAIEEQDRVIEKVRRDTTLPFKLNEPAWFNEQGVVPASEVTFQRNLGLIMFHEPCVLTKPAYARKLPHLRAVEVGLPIVTYGVEHKWGAAEDCVYVNVAEEGALSINEPVGTAPKVIREPTLRLYADEGGAPMNLPEVKERALALAHPLIARPTSELGYRYVFGGFWPFEPNEEVSGVTWSWEDDKPLTEVLVNEYQYSRRGLAVEVKRAMFNAGSIRARLGRQPLQEGYDVGEGGQP